MKLKRSSMLIAVICVAVLSVTAYHSGYAAATADSGIQYNSQGKIVFDNGTEDTADDVVFDASDFWTIDGMVTRGKTAVKDELNRYEGIEINEDIPTFDTLAASVGALADGTDAAAENILSGKRALVGKSVVIGSMNDCSGKGVSADKIIENGGNAEITIPKGYYDEDSKIEIPINTIIKEIPSVGGVYYLGSGSGSYNISTMPNYNKFTNANFIVCTSSAWAGYHDAVNNVDRSVTAAAAGYSYNPSNGVLTVNDGNQEGCDTSNTTLGRGWCRARSSVGAVYLVTGSIKGL